MPVNFTIRNPHVVVPLKELREALDILKNGTLKDISKVVSFLEEYALLPTGEDNIDELHGGVK